jgi:hypothetical protein
MTDCTKPVRRKVRVVSNWVRTGQIVVSLYPHGELGVRELRTRCEYRLTVAELFRHAATLAILKKGRRVKELRGEGHTLAEARRLAKREFGF